jgi:beta-mannosidase
VNNEPAQPLAATLELKLYRHGETSVGSATRAITLAGRETAEIPAATLFESFLDLSYAYRFGPAPHDVVVASLVAVDGGTLAEAFHFSGGMSAARELDIGLTATATVRDETTFEVRIASRRFAQSLWIEAEGFSPDDAYFHLAPGSNRTLLLRRTPNEPVRPLRGRVHALNAHTPAKIELRG